jgi:geranylgeranyl diphosphate synthase, type II
VNAAASLDLGAYLAAEAVRIEDALRRALARATPDVPGSLAGPLGHGVLSGGKRVRPILCRAAYVACAGRDGGPALDDLAASLELIHAYSLMHDDLPSMDDAALRRGRPTTHRVHGVRTTTLAGLALIPLAARQALEAGRALGLDEAEARDVVRLLLDAAGPAGMVGGQALDLLGEDRSLDADELDELHRLKTGALLAAAPRMGAHAAGAPAPVREALARYGGAVGLAFQIADDLLDATATAAELGKNPSDAERGKSTYVALYGLDEARRRGEAQVRAALEALDEAGLEAPPLRALARYILHRSH